MNHFRVSAFLMLAVLVTAPTRPQQAGDPMAIAERAYQLQEAGDYAGAVDAYQAFLKLRPDEPAARSNLGACLVKLGRYEEAIKQYQMAEKLLPGDARIGMNLALAYEKSGQLPAASKKLEELHSAAPQDKQITSLLADCKLQTGENNRVIELLEPLEKSDPSDLATVYMLGTALIREKRVEEGQALLDVILHNGDSAESRFLMGTQFYESGDFPKAVKQLAGAIELNPNLPQLHSYYGLALLQTGDPEAASEAFRKELAEDPNDFSSNLALGQILVVSRHFDTAKPLLEHALLLRPQSTDAMLAMGECQSGTGNLSEARRNLEAVTRAVPESLEAHRELLSVYTRLHRAPQVALERTAVNRLQGEVTADASGPKVHEMAPNFELSDIATKKKVKLSDFRGKGPVALVFGSYTCPNFRSSAGSLDALYQRYGRKVPFFLVYIREAHAEDNWQSTRNERQGIALAPAKTMPEKEEHAVMCSLKLHLQFPALVDGMDGRVEAAYSAWPSRAFVIGTDGRILYSSGLSQLDFNPKDMEQAIRTAMTRNRIH